MAATGSKVELSPYKVCVCILIYESLANSGVHSYMRLSLHSYLIDRLFAVREKEQRLAELLQDMQRIDQDCTVVGAREFLAETLSRVLGDLECCNDLIIFFNSRLTELRSDAEINLGYMDEGGVLYLFLRKCLNAFVTLDFEGLIKLFERLQEYKAGRETHWLPASDMSMLVSYMSEALPQLCTQLPYSQLSDRINRLPISSRYLLQAHIDSYYCLPSAIDHLHRHFDQDLDRSLPPQSIRKSKVPISKSFTYYAPLHRVKIELQLGHLETAVHLLVETVKRELSEGDSAAILESSLLFCKIAGLTGNWTQERALSERCVLRAIEKKHPAAVILSALNCAQLDAIYPHLASPDIGKTLAPKPDPKRKKPQGPSETPYFHDPTVDSGTAVKELALQTMLDSHSFATHSSQLLQVQVLNWLSEGNLTAALADFSVLCKLSPKLLSSRDDVEIALILARESCQHSQKQTLSLLEMVDKACLVKECIGWDFTVNYVSAVWGLMQGKYAFAEWFERRMEAAMKGNLDKCYGILLGKLKGERLLREERLQEAQHQLLSLSTELSPSGLQSLLIQTSLLLSELYLQTGQSMKSLFEVLKCLPALQHSHKDYYSAHIQLAEVLLAIYPNSLRSLHILHKIRPGLREEAVERVQGRYFVCRAKCKLAIAQQIGSGERIRRAAVEDLNEALSHFQEVKAVSDARMAYYLLSRTFHQLNMPIPRDQSADHFLSLQSFLNLSEKELPSCPLLSDLTSPLPFPPVPLV